MQDWVDELQPELNKMSAPEVIVHLIILPRNQHWVTTGAGKEDNYYFQNGVVGLKPSDSVLNFHNYQAIILRKSNSDCSSTQQELATRENEIMKLYQAYFYNVDETWEIQNTIVELAHQIHLKFPSTTLILAVYRKGANHETCIHLLAYRSYGALRTDKLRSRPCAMGTCGHACITLLLY